MELIIISQGKDEHSKLADIPKPVVDLTLNERMTFCVVEGGMRSGDPSVIIISSDDEGSVCLQTSLDKLLTGAAGVAALAKNRWGWEQQEGTFTIMPPSKEAQKALLESIKKELEEWSDD